MRRFFGSEKVCHISHFFFITKHVVNTQQPHVDHLNVQSSEFQSSSVIRHWHLPDWKGLHRSYFMTKFLKTTLHVTEGKTFYHFFHSRKDWGELKRDLYVDQKWVFRMIQATYILRFLRQGRYDSMMGKKVGVVFRRHGLQGLWQWVTHHLYLGVRYLDNWSRCC